MCLWYTFVGWSAYPMHLVCLPILKSNTCLRRTLRVLLRTRELRCVNFLLCWPPHARIACQGGLSSPRASLKGTPEKLPPHFVHLSCATLCKLPEEKCGGELGGGAWLREAFLIDRRWNLQLINQPFDHSFTKLMAVHSFGCRRSY